jgi:autotransporter-associated beta strand protein
MTLALSPGGGTVSNSALSYQLNAADPGSLAGSTSLAKDSTNSLGLNSANSFSGPITVKAGTLIAGNATALGTDTASTHGYTAKTACSAHQRRQGVTQDRNVLDYANRCVYR